MTVLRQQLIKFARGLASEQWFSSGTYETTPEERVQEAVAYCKADIGKALLEALEVTESDPTS